MRHLADTKQGAPEIVLVTMREKYDCLTCVAAMLLGIKYEEVKAAFGGNLDPSRDHAQEAQRIAYAFETLFQQNQCGVLHLFDQPTIQPGRRYWVSVRIDDPTNALSKNMTHSIVINEAGRAFDPNREYGEFNSLAEWRAAMTLQHEIAFITEIFGLSL